MTTKEDIRGNIDSENGEGYSLNINLNGYVFTKNNSFIVFEFKILEDVKVCHIKYIYFDNQKDLTTIIANCCNFWMGNKVQFLFYKEKTKIGDSALEMLKGLNFRVASVDLGEWKFDFKCKKCEQEICKCNVYKVCK